MGLDDVIGTGWAVIGVDVTDTDEWAAVDPIAARLGATTACVPTSQTMPRLNRRVLVDVDGRLDAEFEPYRGRFVLLRPDHFVAAAWYPDETASTADAVGTWTA